MYGTPVLGANIGGIPELIKVGETGELFESGSSKELSLKTESMWNNAKIWQISGDGILTTEHYAKFMLRYYWGKARA